jgi:hypothetical protein
MSESVPATEVEQQARVPTEAPVDSSVNYEQLTSWVKDGLAREKELNEPEEEFAARSVCERAEAQLKRIDRSLHCLDMYNRSALKCGAGELAASESDPSGAGASCSDTFACCSSARRTARDCLS